MRVTENMKFNSAVNNLFNSQSQYSDIMDKIATQKMVNRASDDPIAATKIIEIRQGQATNAQYSRNMDDCDAWLSMTESKLSNANDLLVKAHEIAMAQATATATGTTRKVAAMEVQSLIDEMGNLANAKMGSRYLFSGSRDTLPPFSTTRLNATVEPAGKARNNVFAGTVTSSGTYTGTTNQTYAVKITNAGALDTARCQVSTDGGRTWNGADLAMNTGIISLGDGVSLTFDDGGGTKAFATNDVFHVNTIAEGYYNGNGETLSVTVNRGTEIGYNITGADAFTSAGAGGADVFATLNDLKDALEGNQIDQISGQLGHLKEAQEQVTLNQSLCGTKASHIEVARNNVSQLDERLASLLSAAQDADLSELATKLSMKELALKASYAMAAKIGDTTILNFIK
jgi:flagellar hook-associated protein 3 FlgL